jgi:hypothetical protein
MLLLIFAGLLLVFLIPMDDGLIGFFRSNCFVLPLQVLFLNLLRRLVLIDVACGPLQLIDSFSEWRLNQVVWNSN